MSTGKSSIAFATTSIVLLWKSHRTAMGCIAHERILVAKHLFSLIFFTIFTKSLYIPCIDFLLNSSHFNMIFFYHSSSEITKIFLKFTRWWLSSIINNRNINVINWSNTFEFSLQNGCCICPSSWGFGTYSYSLLRVMSIHSRDT